MTGHIEIRESRSGDIAALEALYPAAFPDEDLLPVVRSLLEDPTVVDSYLGCVGDDLAGHVFFTSCSLPGTREKLSLLGPLAVAPERQRAGVGAALVRYGLDRQKQAGVTRVLVLGDPKYYGRFGFTMETDIQPPYAIPAEWREAWQSLLLTDGGEGRAGVLNVPGPWQEERYWAP